MNPIFKNRPNKEFFVKDDDGDRHIWESRAPAVVVVIFALSKSTMYVLAEKRSDTMVDAPGRWVLPSGYIDWDETGWDAVRREVYEETSFYIDKYKKYCVYYNDKEPFYVMTNPIENRQNISLNYYIVYDFKNKSIPKKIESYKYSEISKIKWIDYKDIHNPEYDWAFLHDERIEMALEKYGLTFD